MAPMHACGCELDDDIDVLNIARVEPGWAWLGAGCD